LVTVATEFDQLSTGLYANESEDPSHFRVVPILKGFVPLFGNEDQMYAQNRNNRSSAPVIA
jgi:hypothetical protein